MHGLCLICLYPKIWTVFVSKDEQTNPSRWSFVRITRCFDLRTPLQRI